MGHDRSRFNASLSTRRIAVGNVNAVTYDAEDRQGAFGDRVLVDRRAGLWFCRRGRSARRAPRARRRPELAADRIHDDIGAIGEQLARRASSSSGRDDEIGSDRRGYRRRGRPAAPRRSTGPRPAALNIARNRQPMAPAPKMIADSPGRGFALLTPFTTQASGSISAAIRATGRRTAGTRLGRRLDLAASAPSRNTPSARTFSQLAGPAGAARHTTAFRIGVHVTRWPIARPPTRRRRRYPADELVAHHTPGSAG